MDLDGRNVDDTQAHLDEEDGQRNGSKQQSRPRRPRRRSSHPWSTRHSVAPPASALGAEWPPRSDRSSVRRLAR